MERFRRLFAFFLPLLLLTVLTGQANAALLDFGPIVPEVVGSTPPNLRTGFPLWFRDTNRVPLELCLEEVPGCLFAAVDRPNLALPLAFPNLPGELFYYSATALIGQQLLFAGVEMNFFDNGDGTYEQVGFSRVRIRIDSTIAGDYTVTTPWKQYFFTVDQATIDATGGLRVINATEDIGLGPDGVFAGVLAGSIGPYVYSQGAPFVTAAGSFLGTGLPLTVTGSTFTDPFNGQPANIFRIQGPAGFATVSTDQFAITGKLYITAPTPTPLTVDKVTYALDNSTIQVNAFATTEAVSNQTNSALPFPQNFALTGTPSALQLTGSGIPTQVMATNNPADGKFFSASGLFTAPATLPPTVTVTNTSDISPTVKTVPLVDEVVITRASYNPVNSTLSIVASSSDRVAVPALQAFIPGMTVPIGTLSNGLLNVSFPFTDNSGPQSKTYNIPPSSVQVVSLIGGSATASVSVVVPPPPPVAVNDATSTAAETAVVVSVLINDTTTGALDPASIVTAAAVGGTAVANSVGTVTFTPAAGFTGQASFTYTVKDILSQVSNSATVTVTVTPVVPAPATGVVVSANLSSPEAAQGTQITFIASGSGGSGSYEYSYWLFNGTSWSEIRPYSTTSNWTWDTTGLATGVIYAIAVNVRSVGSTALFEAVAYREVKLNPTAINLVVAASTPSPQLPGTSVTFSAAASGSSGNYSYQFYLFNGTSWTLVQDFSSVPTWTWDSTGLPAGDYLIGVNVLNSSLVGTVANGYFSYTLTTPVTSVNVISDQPSPHTAGTPVTFVASGVGGSGTYEYEFSFFNGVTWSLVKPYSGTGTWTLPGATVPGNYVIGVNARNAGASNPTDVVVFVPFIVQ